MSEPKSIEEVPSWVIVNALRCPIESQISIVAKLLQHLDRDQRAKALSMSGVGGCQCKDGKWHDKKVGGWICSMCGVPV